MKKSKINLIKTILLILAFAGFMVQDANAQRQYGDVGLGVQVGQPSGVTLKFYNPGMSVDILAAWDLDDFFFVNVHGIFAKGLNDEHSIHFLYGPGVYMGIRDRGPNDSDVELGISGTIGIDFIIDKFEIYLHATPRFSLIEETDFDMGGGIGIRFYL